MAAPTHERADRLRVVLQVLYLIYNEGYTTSSGPALQRADLTAEAIRLTRMLHQLLPGEGEAAGLLALMLLTDARRAARTTADGSLVPLAEQQRARWNTAQLEEGVALVTRTLGTVPIGPYQLQAAINAVHDAGQRRPHGPHPPPRGGAGATCSSSRGTRAAPASPTGGPRG